LSLYLSLLASCGLSFLHYCNLCDGKVLPIEVLMLFEHGLLILASVLAASVDRERLILQGLGFIYSVFFFLGYLCIDFMPFVAAFSFVCTVLRLSFFPA
jgi:hypothetical protein